MMRRLLLSVYGLSVGAGYAAALQFAIPGESDLLPVRGLNIVLLMGLYGWCCGKDPFLPLSRVLIEVPLLPFALLGALAAGCICMVSLVITRLTKIFTRIARR